MARVGRIPPSLEAVSDQPKGQIGQARHRGGPRRSGKTHATARSAESEKILSIGRSGGIGLLWMGLAASPTVAQQPPVRTQGASTVALLDVNYIFKKHARFKSQMEEMRGDVERSQAEWKRQAEGMNKLAERLNEFRPGTPDYKAMEEEIVNQRTKLQATMTIAKKEFLQREAKVYYNVYQEIMQEVKYYCEANGVTLVMTFNGDKINPENPEDVLRGINQKVVYYNPSWT